MEASFFLFILARKKQKSRSFSQFQDKIQAKLIHFGGLIFTVHEYSVKLYNFLKEENDKRKHLENFMPISSVRPV